MSYYGYSGSYSGGSYYGNYSSGGQYSGSSPYYTGGQTYYNNQPYYQPQNQGTYYGVDSNGNPLYSNGQYVGVDKYGNPIYGNPANYVTDYSLYGQSAGGGAGSGSGSGSSGGGPSGGGSSGGGSQSPQQQKQQQQYKQPVVYRKAQPTAQRQTVQPVYRRAQAPIIERSGSGQSGGNTGAVYNPALQYSGPGYAYRSGGGYSGATSQSGGAQAGYNAPSIMPYVLIGGAALAAITLTKK